jgi:glutaredoxin
MPYEEKDVTKDMEARNELIKRKVMGVPAFLIGGEMVVGFDKARINALAKK